MSSAPTVSAIILAHAEGIMANISIHSLEAAARHFESAGHAVECIAVLDRPDAATKDVFASLPETWSVFETDFGDQGKARNEAVKRASGAFVAFLDADDLWSFNWLERGFAICNEDPRIIAHPQFNYFFGANNNVLIMRDQTDPAFDPKFLRYANYWDALSMARRETYLEFPFCDREIARGFAFEDWHWNCVTLEGGYVHRVVPRTVHFKRRRVESQTLIASRSGALVRPTRLFSYDWTYRAPDALPASAER